MNNIFPRRYFSPPFDNKKVKMFKNYCTKIWIENLIQTVFDNIVLRFSSKPSFVYICARIKYDDSLLLSNQKQYSNTSWNRRVNTIRNFIANKS